MDKKEYHAILEDIFSNSDLEIEIGFVDVLALKASKLEEDSSLAQSDIYDELWDIIPSEFEDNDEMVGIIEELSDMITAELIESEEIEEEEE